ncbi:MAG TPA: hypothetical protein VF316_09800, partial [Polyangiaceae bacterium]
MNARSLLLSAIVAAACFACGGRTSPGSSTLGSDGGTSSVTLTIPLGSYSGCTSSMVTVSPHFEGTAGGYGTITLVQENDSVVASLAFAPFVSGKIAFTPTSTASAAFATGRSYDVETVDFKGSNATVSETTGSLVLVGDTLFIAVHGQTVSADVSGHFHCPVPATLQPTSVVTNAPPSAALTPGVFGPCTSSVGATNSTLSTGGSGSVMVTSSAGNLSATWNDDVTPVCKSLDFTASSDAATLVTGQTCSVQRPCGPPPSLGPSPAPSVATLTGTAGS